MLPNTTSSINKNQQQKIQKQIRLQPITQIKTNTDQLKPQKQNNQNVIQTHNTKSDQKTQKKPITVQEDWDEYERTVYEMPFSPLQHGTSYYLHRWRILSPFNKRIIYGWTIGEIIFLLILITYVAVTVPLTYCNPCSKRQSDGEQDQLYTKSGTVAQFPMLLTFLFSMRNSIWTFLFGITFERQLVWHKILAVITAAMALYHGLLAKFKLNGWLTFGCLAGLLFFSLPPFRRKVYEFFYRTHWILFIGVVAFGLMHGATIGVLGFIGNIIDFILRAIIISRNKKNSFEVIAVRLPADVIRLTFKKGSFDYKAGQYAFICLPELSYFEWHPFSVSSAPHHEYVTFHIRVIGDWTSRLGAIVGKTEQRLAILIDGPYGNPSINIDSDKYKIFLMISGGIGITPMQSITNELLEQYSRGRPLKKIFFVWSVRDHFMISDVQNHDFQYLQKNLPKQLPYSFSPDLLEDKQSKYNQIIDLQNILDSRFQLTQLKRRDKSELEKCNIKPEQMPYLKFGRTNLQKLFKEVQKKANDLSENKVAVLCCGPSQLLEDIASEVQSINSTDKSGLGNKSYDLVRFDLHEEIFSL